MKWLQLSTPHGVERIRVSPLSLGGLHALVSARLSRTLPHPAMAKIVEISGGNPSYALELAHATHIGSARAQPSSKTPTVDVAIPFCASAVNAW